MNRESKNKRLKMLKIKLGEILNNNRNLIMGEKKGLRKIYKQKIKF